jgi:hypothetical protein
MVLKVGGRKKIRVLYLRHLFPSSIAVPARSAQSRIDAPVRSDCRRAPSPLRSRAWVSSGRLPDGRQLFSAELVARRLAGFVRNWLQMPSITVELRGVIINPMTDDGRDKPQSAPTATSLSPSRRPLSVPPASATPHVPRNNHIGENGGRRLLAVCRNLG